MAEATVEHILQEVRMLSEDDRRRLREALDGQLDGRTELEKNEAYRRALVKAGVIGADEALQPLERFALPPLVHLEGEPLSETIMRERR